MTFVFHCVEVTNNCFNWIIGQSFKADQVMIKSNGTFFLLALHVECHEDGSRSSFYCKFLQLVKSKTDLWIFINKADFTSAKLYKTHLESYLSDGEDQIGFLWDETNESVTSIFRAEDNSDLYSVQKIILFILWVDSHDAITSFIFLRDNFPELGTDWSPLPFFLELHADSNGVEFEVVSFLFELFDQLVLEIEKETVSEWEEEYTCSRMSRGGILNVEGTFLRLSEWKFFHLDKERGTIGRGRGSWDLLWWQQCQQLSLKSS